MRRSQPAVEQAAHPESGPRRRPHALPGSFVTHDDSGRATHANCSPIIPARFTLRVNDLIDNQVRSLRKRQVIRSFQRGRRSGTYWGIRTPFAAYGLKNTLPCPVEATLELAATPTRLQRLEPERQEQLVNWGYAVCDAAMRAHVDASLPAAQAFPYTVGVVANV